MHYWIMELYNNSWSGFGCLKTIVVSMPIKQNIEQHSLSLNHLDKSLKINAYPGILATNILGRKMAKKNWGRIISTPRKGRT